MARSPSPPRSARAGTEPGGAGCVRPSLQLLLPQPGWPSATPLASLQGQAWGTKQEDLAEH